MNKTSKVLVTFGGWYQRTTLHLSEIYGLFEGGMSNLDLSTEKLKNFQNGLNLESVTREAGHLEYVKAITSNGIEIRYYEDGLYVLELESNSFKEGKKILTDYFENFLKPATDYIFSLGAPTPKILANIKHLHPFVLSVTSKKPEGYKVSVSEFGEVYGKMSSEDTTVYKTPKSILIVSSKEKERVNQDLVEMQIFFREFKDQLEKYLNIHRTIWEEITQIKEQKFLKGKEVAQIRAKLESYKKTIDLIASRINQMESYIHTRQSISKQVKVEEKLNTLFQYKFEVLKDTHSYIKEIWKMTKDYIDSAIAVVVEIESKATSVSIKSLQVITSIGVVSGILGYLAGDRLPKISYVGVVYLILLIFATWVINMVILKFYKNQKYKLNFVEREKKI